MGKDNISLSFEPVSSKIIFNRKFPRRFVRDSIDPNRNMDESMGSVHCVKLNDEGGIRTLKEAIRISKNRGDSIVFLFIADSSILNKLATPIVVDVTGILESMGRFILCAAVEHALI